MLRYTIRRFFLMIPTLFGVAVLVFILLRAMPGDIVEMRMLMDGGQVSPEALALERARLGLDQPLLYQFYHWITGIMVGDFGTSMPSQQHECDALRRSGAIRVAFARGL